MTFSTFTDWFNNPRPWEREGVERLDVEGELSKEERFSGEPAPEWVKRNYPDWDLGGSVIVQQYISAVIYRPRDPSWRHGETPLVTA